MNSNPNVQTGATPPITITLASDAFPKALAAIPLNKENWDGEDHIRVVETLLEHLVDANGKKVDLSADKKDRIRLVYRPVQETQQRVLLQTFADAGCELEQSARSILLSLISMTEFAKRLSKNIRPGTNSPYITLKKTRGVKGDVFDALFGAAANPSQPSAAVPPQQQEPASQVPAQEMNDANSDEPAPTVADDETQKPATPKK